LSALDFKRVENWGKSALELDIDDGTNDLGDLSVGLDSVGEGA